MNRSQYHGHEAVKMLGCVANGEAWLLSVEVAADQIKMVCDSSSWADSTIEDKADEQKMLLFEGVSHLSFFYEQNVFGSEENDISTIDGIKIDKIPDKVARDRWRASFEFTYGRLDFTFGFLKLR